MKQYTYIFLALALSGCNSDKNTTNTTSYIDNVELNRTLTYLTETVVLADGKCWEQHVEPKEIDGVTKYVAPENIVGVRFAGEIGVWTAINDCSQYINNTPLSVGISPYMVDRETVDCYTMNEQECKSYSECMTASAPSYSRYDPYNKDKYCIGGLSIFVGCVRQRDGIIIDSANMMNLGKLTIFSNKETNQSITAFQNASSSITENQDRSPDLAKWQFDELATKEMYLYYQELGKVNGQDYVRPLSCSSEELKDINLSN